MCITATLLVFIKFCNNLKRELTKKYFSCIIKVYETRLQLNKGEFVMGKASNKLELSQRLSGCYSSNSPKIVKLKQSDTDVNDTIHRECNKPLQSKFYVEGNSKTRFEWKYNSDKHYGVYRAVGNLWLCRDRNISTLSDCEREQIKLYNKLKREYEREQKMLRDKEVSETVVTAEDKARARSRKVSYFMNKEYYDRIYKVV